MNHLLLAEREVALLLCLWRLYVKDSDQVL